MDTVLNIKAVDQAGHKLQKTITDVNPNADGSALKTFAQGLNNLTTNTYTGTTKVNLDILTDPDDSGCNPLPAPKIYIGWIVQGGSGVEIKNWQPLKVSHYRANCSCAVRYATVFLATDSTGNLNSVSMPQSANILIGKIARPIPTQQLPQKYVDDLGENFTYWIIGTVTPSADDIGKFTVLLNATDTNSSVTITLNVTEISD